MMGIWFNNIKDKGEWLFNLNFFNTNRTNEKGLEERGIR